MPDSNAAEPILSKRTREAVLAEIKANFEKHHIYANQLLTNIKENRSRIEGSLSHIKKVEGDLVYYFYHQSWDIFQYRTALEVNKALFESLSPDKKPLNSWFVSICETAIRKEFSDSTNANWASETQPILDAYWHTRYFLEQMLIAGEELETAPEILPYGWAAVLYLYNLR